MGIEKVPISLCIHAAQLPFSSLLFAVDFINDSASHSRPWPRDSSGFCFPFLSFVFFYVVEIAAPADLMARAHTRWFNSGFNLFISVYICLYLFRY